MVRQPFTSNQAELAAAIRDTAAGGSTSLYNATYIALKELAKIRSISGEAVRRQALVLFSDGEDTLSIVPFDQVLDLAKRSETTVYTIALRGADMHATRVREAEFVLRTLAQETGGRVFFPHNIDDLSGVYAQIGEELANRYALGYVSNNPKRDGAWRRVVVRVARPDATARTRQGYYAPLRGS
jgi:VWFA-related protein